MHDQENETSLEELVQLLDPARIDWEPRAHPQPWRPRRRRGWVGL